MSYFIVSSSEERNNQVASACQPFKKQDVSLSSIVQQAIGDSRSEDIAPKRLNIAKNKSVPFNNYVSLTKTKLIIERIQTHNEVKVIRNNLKNMI